MTEEEKKKTETDKAQASIEKQNLMSRGLCLKCGEYIKHDERDMNVKGYCPTCQSNRKDKMSYKVIIELEYENKPKVENVLEYIEELGTDLDYKLINNSKKTTSEQTERIIWKKKKQF